MATAPLRFSKLCWLLALVSAWMYQCACGKPLAPDVLYEQVRKEAQRGDLDAALKNAQKGLRDYTGRDVGWAWQFRVLNAHILVMRGANSEALHLLNENLPEALENSETAVRKKLVSGIARDGLQQFDAAEADLDAAARLAHAFQPALLASVEQSRGQLEMDRTNYAQAETDFQAALSAARQQKQPYLENSALGSLGNAAMAQEHFDAAIDWYRQALKLGQSIGMQSSVARALGSMGWSSFQLGDFERARALYQQGADLSQQSGLLADRVYWLTGVAESQFALGDYAAAEAVLRQALGLAEKQDDKRILVTFLNDLTVVMLGTDRVELAQAYNQRALDIERAGLDRSGVLDTKMLEARISATHRDFAKAEGLFREIVSDPKADQASRWEAQAHLATLYEDQNLPGKAEDEFVQSLQTIQAARASITEEEFRLSFLSSSISFYGDYLDFLISRGRADDALRVAERSRGWTLEEGLRGGPKAGDSGPDTLRPQEIARRTKATLLFYWLGRQHSYLWIIAPESMACLTLPPATQIDPAVRSYRDAAAGAKDILQSQQTLGEKLYAMLVAPAEKLIAPNARVILLPDGSLNALNFETLIVPAAKPHFWIEDVTITSASSLTLLASRASHAVPKLKKLLLVGDALKASDDFDPLPLAEDEMRVVQRYFPPSDRTVLKGEQATPRAYLNSHPDQYAYLHFVTHGTASRAWPLESAVILSREAGSDSYKLYARDIVTRHLNAELVTISACNGSGIRAYSGEGLVGLAWAFLRAGAHHVIGALWEVSNAPSTVQFMDVFYKGLSQGQDAASALRNAKLSFLHSSDPQSAFKKPYYWAPFQLYAGS